MNIEQNIYRIMGNKDIPFEISEHEPVYTSEGAAQVRGVALRTGVKAMVLKADDRKHILALVPGDKQVNLVKIAQLEGAKQVKLADPHEVLAVTGCAIGSVPPFGHLTQLKTYMDKDILKNEYVNFNVGEHTKSVCMKARNLVKCIRPILM